MAEVIIFSARSINGRWGTDVIGPSEFEGKKFFPGWGFSHLGRAAGVEAYRLVPCPGNIAVIGDDLSLVSGAVVVLEQSLQGGSSVTLLHATVGGVVRWRGYKGRSGGYEVVLSDGLKEAPSSILLAAGLISSAEPPKAAPSAPPADSAVLIALRAAGLA